MQPLAVDLVLLRAAAPDIALRPGTLLPARVLERHGAHHGLIDLAGAVLAAELPPAVEAGTRLRLRVAGTEADRLLLRIEQQPPPPALPPLSVPLPNGTRAEVRVTEDDPGRRRPGDPEGATVALR